jgi:hypothetical protein
MQLLSLFVRGNRYVVAGRDLGVRTCGDCGDFVLGIQVVRQEHSGSEKKIRPVGDLTGTFLAFDGTFEFIR